ncbi:16S rRNA (uracil(1498)-N(3))-methyltransferase [Listeria fleischmannii]|uniref:16S rRNA (uracil(1498)-N(3))-methyltransferase n=1 Tax=Listeria fleischmannii TaxID=1069827 RepID=UPI001625DBF9|nr:16S rRNA (uracil(1498)-N(3))-methyltransferase [Listeria fleischmannii]MBC1419029.1 16S rRNA (uracil(1498)-N(3))-methyltransferase [Listeria fleischmannii]
MQRYFTNEKLILFEPFFISGDDFHHMSRVMRMKSGEKVYIVDQEENAFIAEVIEIGESAVKLRPQESIEKSPELPVQITIASGLPKGDKLDLIVQKATELGAFSFLPFPAERSISRWETKKVRKKIERLEKIAKEAAEQSHRTHIPTITFCESFAALMNRFAEFDYVLLAYEESARSNETKTLVATFEKMKPGEKLLVIFGPEGGVSDKEVTLLTQANVLFAGLGSRILRTETAPLYFLAAASYFFELEKSF